jgi:hypothetical protein
MAICETCGLEMLIAVSCTATQYCFTDGIPYTRIRYGDETRTNFIATSQVCHDCGIIEGHYHHPGCDVEECPRCHRQAISCDCND